MKGLDDGRAFATDDGDLTNRAREWTTSTIARRFTAQFTRVEQSLLSLPGRYLPVRLQARVFGMSSSVLRRELRRSVEAVGGAAREVLAEPGLEAAARVIRRSYAGRSIVCLGDSITADRQSWAEIMSVILGPDVTVINAGRSGDTSADMIARFHLSVRAHRPAVVIIMAGTNDARRYTSDLHASNGYGSLIIDDDGSDANFQELERLALSISGAAVVWIVPPPIDDPRVATHPAGRLAHARWTDDEVKRKGDLVTRRFRRVADARAEFDRRGVATDLLMEDGLHPNLAGQKAITIVALKQLTRTANPD